MAHQVPGKISKFSVYTGKVLELLRIQSKILKASRKREWITYRLRSIRLATDFSSMTPEAVDRGVTALDHGDQRPAAWKAHTEPSHHFSIRVKGIYCYRRIQRCHLSFSNESTQEYQMKSIQTKVNQKHFKVSRDNSRGNFSFFFFLKISKLTI